MSLLLEWSKLALNDIDEIIDFIFSENPPAAMALEQLIHDSVNNLVFMPYIGRIGRVENTRELIFHPNYFIAYEIDRNIIRIMRILHCRKQYPQH